MTDKPVTDMRKKIDAIDQNIHDLLMKRAELVVEIGEIKREKNLPAIQPAREAALIRGLLERHKGPMSSSALIGIWREIIGAVSMLQTDLKVSVSAAENQGYCWDMAKDHFGSVVPMMKASSALTAISALREGEAVFAVIPWPHDSDQNPWWSYLTNQQGDSPMRICWALPFVNKAVHFDNIHDKALIISKGAFMPSGQDHSFLSLEIDPSVSRTRIFDTLTKIGLKPLSIYTKAGAVPQATTTHFIEVDNYVAADDTRLSAFESQFDDLYAKAESLGGYPVHPVLKDKSTEKESPGPVSSVRVKKQGTGA